jgi:hypothetical protein
LDALDALRSLGTMPIQTVQSESAASLYEVRNTLKFFSIWAELNKVLLIGNLMEQPP